MRAVLFPVVAENPFCDCGGLGLCPWCPPTELEVDDLLRDYPDLFKAWAEADPGTWDGKDPRWLDRVALASTYADPDRAWKRAADAIRATDTTTLPGLGMIGADVESRIAHAVPMAIEVIEAMWEATPAALREDPAGAAKADLIALALLWALADVEGIAVGERAP